MHAETLLSLSLSPDFACCSSVIPLLYALWYYALAFDDQQCTVSQELRAAALGGSRYDR